MTFYDYMHKKYFRGDTNKLDVDERMMKELPSNDWPKADLAFDLFRERDKIPFMANDDDYDASLCELPELHDTWTRYLMRRGACDDCMETFEICWSEYVLHEAKQSGW